MISEKETTHISKFLSLVLRHAPETIGITLDAQGWVAVDTLLERMASHGQPISSEVLLHVVRTNAKQRFALSDDGTRIRANQGHSVAVSLDYAPATPPDILYHGTAHQHLEAIRREGLDKRSRHHVHLSAQVATARQVGGRHGKPVVLVVDAAAMQQAGHTFYISDNGVWLTDHVPPQFLTTEEER